ncbi:hypothetical protein ACQRIU_005097 [Beauveria bassiana]
MRTFTRRLPGALPLPRASIAPCVKTLSRPLAASRPRTTTMAMRCQQQLLAARSLHTTSFLSKQKKAQEHTPTNFQDLDVLGNTPVPSTSVDVCMYDGFGLNSGITITDGDGALLVDGEAFTWRPWEISGELRLLNDKGQFDVPAETLGVFDMLWPRPDLLIVGTGKSIAPLSPDSTTIKSCAPDFVARLSHFTTPPTEGSQTIKAFFTFLRILRSRQIIFVPLPITYAHQLGFRQDMKLLALFSMPPTA